MYDTLTQDGFVVDGTGRPLRVGDVAIRAGKIAAVGQGIPYVFVNGVPAVVAGQHTDARGGTALHHVYPPTD